MAEHYRIARNHGMTTVRDGLVPGHHAVARLVAARQGGVQAIWDLSHYHRNQDPARCAHIAAEAALAVNDQEKLWLCPVNEPSLYPVLAGMPRHEAIGMAVTMARVAPDYYPGVGILKNDPITGSANGSSKPVDVDVIGINYYPHTARTSLTKILLTTWCRYRKPIMVSETSWHDGHPVHHCWHPGLHKGGWLRYVLGQVDVAKCHGAVVVGVCWYPVVDCPPWHAPYSPNRWSHGLIKRDLSIDASLSAELACLGFRNAS